MPCGFRALARANTGGAHSFPTRRRIMDGSPFGPATSSGAILTGLGMYQGGRPDIVPAGLCSGMNRTVRPYRLRTRHLTGARDALDRASSPVLSLE